MADEPTTHEGAPDAPRVASATALTVTFSVKPTTVGSLTAVVTSNGLSSGAPVQVATVTPVVTADRMSRGARRRKGVHREGARLT